jgi:hypothetical protein
LKIEDGSFHVHLIRSSVIVISDGSHKFCTRFPEIKCQSFN